MRTLPVITAASLFLACLASAQMDPLVNGPVLVVAPLMVDFGAVKSHTTVTNTFLVKNVGEGRMEIAMKAAEGGPFRIVSGGTCTLDRRTVGVVTIAYTPTGAPFDEEIVLRASAGHAGIKVTGRLSTAGPCEFEKRKLVAPHDLDDQE